VFQDGCIVCPSTDSTFDLRTGEIKEWYPKNPVLRALTPALRKLFTYRVRTDEANIYISISGSDSVGSAEIIFSGKAQPGVTASDVNVEEVSDFSSLILCLPPSDMFFYLFILFDMIPAFLINFSIQF
jgi:hypothetical protein